jgi:signal transduction histidine kinase
VAEAFQSLPDDVVEVVHDLRAPLGVASGYLSMLMDGTFGPPPAQWSMPLDVLSLKLEEARTLVDDVLTLRRMDQDVGVAPGEVVDLTEAARTAAQRAQPRANLLKGSVVVDAPSGEPVMAKGDPRRTLRILDNLINNALLYSGENRRVVLRVEQDAGPQVTVEDSGPGISGQLRDHLFEPFSRGDRTSQIGSGLGLFISRTLARQMCGELTLTDRRGARGSRFVLRLPAPSGA